MPESCWEIKKKYISYGPVEFHPEKMKMVDNGHLISVHTLFIYVTDWITSVEISPADGGESDNNINEEISFFFVFFFTVCPIERREL